MGKNFHVQRYQLLRETFGGLGACPQKKFSRIPCSRTSENAILCTHLESRNLIVSKSNQTNAKKMEKYSVCRERNSGVLPQKDFLKQLSLERRKCPSA